MQVTDEMVRTFARTYYGATPNSQDRQLLLAIEHALTAALATVPDRYREGFETAREMAACLLVGVHGSKIPKDPASWAIGVEDALNSLRQAIRAMEPPE